MAHGIDTMRAFALEKLPPDSRWHEMFGKTFDIEGKGGTGTAREKLKTLLVERFGLKSHLEIRQVPGYALTVVRSGRLGPGLKPSSYNCWGVFNIFSGGKNDESIAPKEVCNAPPTRRYGTDVRRSAGTINDLIERVAGTLLRDPVVDMTGLSGNFEWEVAFAPTDRAQPDVPTIFSAFEDQLGLKFERRTTPYEVVVIDELRMPTPN